MDRPPTKPTDDYQSDIQFGEWLRAQRNQVGKSIEEAAKDAQMKSERLKALEMGLSEHGITRSEAVRLAVVYRIPLDQLLAQATRD